MKKILICGSDEFGSYPNSIKNHLNNLNIFEVFIFDDSKYFLNSFWGLKNRVYFRVMWKIHKFFLQHKLLNFIKSFSPDIILIIKGFYLTVPSLRNLSKHSKIIYFNPDNPFNDWHFGNSSPHLLKAIPLFDLHLTWGKFLTKQISRYGAKRVEHFPFAFDEDLYRDIDQQSIELNGPKNDISFIGSWDSERENILHSLLEFNFKIWGNGWEKSSAPIKKRWQGEAIYGDELKKVCLLSKINLNLVRKQNIPAHNMRSFEISGLGGFVLSTYCMELVPVFSEYKNTSFDSIEDLKEKIRFFLQNDDERKRISRIMQQETLSMHTYKHRAQELASLLSDL